MHCIQCMYLELGPGFVLPSQRLTIPMAKGYQAVRFISFPCLRLLLVVLLTKLPCFVTEKKSVKLTNMQTICMCSHTSGESLRKSISLIILQSFLIVAANDCDILYFMIAYVNTTQAKTGQSFVPVQTNYP